MGIRKRFLPTFAVGMMGLLVSVGIFGGLRHVERLERAELFHESAIEQIAAIENRILTELVMVNSVVRFYSGSNNITRAEFSKFLNAVDYTQGTFEAIEWIPRVPHQQRSAYEAQARADGFGDFAIRQRADDGSLVAATKRSEYFPVYFVEPLEGNEAVLGFDMGSNPARLAALEKARDTDEVVASAPIELVQLEKDRTGFLLFAPIYKPDTQHDTVEQRRENLQGFALGVVRVSSLIAGEAIRKVGAKRPFDLDFYIYDTEVPKDKQLLFVYHSHGTAVERDHGHTVKNGFHEDFAVTVGGRHWVLEARPSNPRDLDGNFAPTLLSFILSLSVTVLLCGYLVQMTRRTEEVENLVGLRTQELSLTTQASKDREERIQAVLETAADGIITISSAGQIETFNRQAELIFGRSAKSVIGQNVNCLMPEPYHSAHDGYLARYDKKGQGDVINISRELLGLRGDGSVFPLALTVTEMHVGGQLMFTGVVRDITERKENERLKNEFISTVSHELRTPLTSIKGALGLLVLGTQDSLPQKMQDMLNIAHNNCDRLVRLINDILDIEKIAAGKMEFQMQALNLGSVLEQAVAQNTAYADGFGVTLRLDECPEDATVYADHDRLMQVITNLLSNAAKFSPPGGEVQLACERVERDDSSEFRVSIIDHGPGIPEEFQEKLFQRFSQVDASDMRAKGGTGLGLSICRAIMQHHGGDIAFQSEEGKGSTFYFTLAGCNDRTQGIEPEQTIPLRRAGDQGPVSRILVCEDEPDIASFLKLLLESDNHLVHVAHTAQEAYDLLEELKFDAMTLDLGLPDENGLNVIRDLRSNPRTSDMPIIVVSAHAQEGQSEINGHAFGVLDWLEKPIDQDRLRAGLKHAVRLTKSRKPNILHIEDDPDVALVVARLAEGVGKVTSVESIERAFEALDQTMFDLVILDLTLPDGDGEQVLPLLKHKNGKPVPVIVFSAKDGPNEHATDIHAALVKANTSNEELVDTIRSVLGNSLD